jgi:hypothetical protein
MENPSQRRASPNFSDSIEMRNAKTKQAKHVLKSNGATQMKKVL